MDYDEDEDDDDWEDIEDWKTETSAHNNISTSNKWNTLPTCPPKPKMNSNNFNQRPSTPPNLYGFHPTPNPLNQNCVSAYNNAYGLNGSLSESSESVPVQPPPEYQVSRN